MKATVGDLILFGSVIPWLPPICMPLNFTCRFCFKNITYSNALSFSWVLNLSALHGWMIFRSCNCCNSLITALVPSSPKTLSPLCMRNCVISWLAGSQVIPSDLNPISLHIPLQYYSFLVCSQCLVHLQCCMMYCHSLQPFDSIVFHHCSPSHCFLGYFQVLLLFIF